jgi:signal transduction histidine kinase/FixJ family two-component response regulator
VTNVVAKNATSSPECAVAGERVLIVEDSLDILSFLAEDVLPYHGYQVAAATTGEEGLDKLSSTDPDLLLLDLELPDMSGIDILKRVQEDETDIPIVLMTAYGSESIAVEAFRLGAKDYIIKPFTTEQVIEVLERTLIETRLRREKAELTDSLQRRVEQLTILSAVGKSVVSLMDIEELLSRIVEAGVYLTSAEEGFLLLVDRESDDLYLRAAKNLGNDQTQGFRLKVDDSLAGEVVRTGKPVRRGGKGTGRDFKVKTGYLVRSLLHMPLVLKGEVIGVLSVDNQLSAVEFSEEDQYLLSTLADYAAISIENSTLYEELRKKMADLERSQQELLESSKLAAVGTLAAGVAHEFNNLLAAISGHTELGLVSDDMNEIKQALKVVIATVDRAKKVTQNLLTFARRREPRMEMTDVTEAVESPLRLMERDLEKSNIELVRRFSVVPPVVCDTGQMSQVCLNLLTNARDALLPEGGTVTVEIREDGEDVIISFTDTGTGVPDRVLDKLFQPFVTTKGPLGGGEMAGSGLGLSVSYGIIKNHGGTIEVETEHGQGSTFTIRLPIEGNGPSR